MTGKPIRKAVDDDAYLDGEFVQTVQQRGAVIIKVPPGLPCTCLLLLDVPLLIKQLEAFIQATLCCSMLSACSCARASDECMQHAKLQPGAVQRPEFSLYTKELSLLLLHSNEG